ncbi:MAG: ATP-binding cassette domain-containing protein [Williamsia sp.]|nr:ATP-binding cassette domain-containing protein [Williamsia sp.]
MRTATEQQLKHNDCGITAVKTIYNLCNIPVSRTYLEENIYLDENGSSLSQIKEFLEREQFTTRYQLLDANSLKADSHQLKNSLPCIMPVRNSQGLHYVVLAGVHKKKIRVIDPARGEQFLWSVTELMNKAHIATADYDRVSNRDVLDKIIQEELSACGLHAEEVAGMDQAEIINKLTYFSYVRENFGFAHQNAERAFIRDLLFNQQMGTLPKQFRSLRISEAKLRIKAPVVLAVHTSQETAPAANLHKAEGEINPYRKLFHELKAFHKLWLIYIVSALFAALLIQVTVFSNQILIDNVLPEYDTNLLIIFAIGLGVFKLFSLVLSTYKNYIAIHLANILDNFFLSSFAEKLNSFPIRYIQSYTRGDLSERVKDSLLLKTFFVRFFTRILIDLFVSLYALGVLFFISWKTALILVVIIALFVGWFRFITPFVRENEKRRFLEKSNLFSALFENIDGLQVIKSFRLETLFMQRLAPKIGSILQIQRRVRYINLLNSGVIDFIIIVATLLIICSLSLTAIHTHSLSTGQVITFIAFSYQIFSSVSSILDENIDLQENQIILNRYFDFGKTQAAGASGAAYQKADHFSIQRIEFRQVAFGYHPQKPLFSGLNVQIHKGELIKLEGNNGTGKSTFCKVLSLLYEADGGDVLVNGEKLVFYNPSALRKKILLVGNDDILFNDTLGFNISFSRSASASAVLELAREIGLYDFIAEKEEGLDFIIHEQGRNLSTGQRKKVLLMRALLSDAEIIILDETLAGIDQESRKKIEHYLNRQTGRSFIVVSHEPLYHLQFSKTLIMNNGKIEQLHHQHA